MLKNAQTDGQSDAKLTQFAVPPDFIRAAYHCLHEKNRRMKQHIAAGAQEDIGDPGTAQTRRRRQGPRIAWSRQSPAAVRGGRARPSRDASWRRGVSRLQQRIARPVVIHPDVAERAARPQPGRFKP